MTTCFLGLGSNLGEPLQQLNNALKQLVASDEIDVLAISSIYKSHAMTLDDIPQQDYLNAVVKIRTQLPAADLLLLVQDIENNQGRTRERKWGERTLDIDIILYGSDIINTKKLQVPHPEMINRRFVLQPLWEIAGNINVSGIGWLNSLLEQVDDQHLIKICEFDGKA